MHLYPNGVYTSAPKVVGHVQALNYLATTATFTFSADCNTTSSMVEMKVAQNAQNITNEILLAQNLTLTAKTLGLFTNISADSLTACVRTTSGAMKKTFRIEVGVVFTAASSIAVYTAYDLAFESFIMGNPARHVYYDNLLLIL